METHQVGQSWDSRYSEVVDWLGKVSHRTLKVGERGVLHILAFRLFKE